MKTVKVGGISVEVSPGCGGVFFDKFELEHFDESHEIKGDFLSEHLSQFHAPTLDYSQRIKCPKCPSSVMMRRYESPLKIIEVDECPTCAGIWLDSAELETIRKNYPSEAKREALRKEMIAEVERHPSVVADRVEHDRVIASLNNVTSALWVVLRGSRPR